MSRQKQQKQIQLHIEKATHRYPKPSKEKHVRAIIQWSLDPSTWANNEIVNRLEKRMCKNNWVVLSKAMVMVHQLFQEGGPGFMDTLKGCSGRFFSLKNFVAVAPPNSMITHFITKYAKYLEEKCSVFRLLGYQFEKNKTACKNLKAAKMKVVHKLQSQFNALLNIKMRRPLISKNMILHRVMLLLLRDAMTLYSILNEGILSLMDEFWTMKKKDALKVVEIYKLFLRETDALLRLFEVGRSYSSSLPRIEKPDAGVVSSMQKYIARLDGQYVSEDSASQHSAELYDHSEEYEDEEPQEEEEEEVAPPSSSSEEEQGDGGLAEFDDFLQDFVLRTLNLKNFQLRVDQNMLTTNIAPVQVGELQIPDMQYLMTGTKSGTPMMTNSKATNSYNFSRASSIPSLSSNFTYQPTPTFTPLSQPPLQTPVFGSPGSFGSPTPYPMYAPTTASFSATAAVGANNPFATNSASGSPFGTPARVSSPQPFSNPFASNSPVMTPGTATNPFATTGAAKSAGNPFASFGTGSPVPVAAHPAVPPAPAGFSAYGPPIIPVPAPEHHHHHHHHSSSSSSGDALPPPPTTSFSVTASGNGLPARQSANNTSNPFLKM